MPTSGVQMQSLFFLSILIFERNNKVKTGLTYCKFQCSLVPEKAKGDSWRTSGYLSVINDLLMGKMGQCRISLFQPDIFNFKNPNFSTSHDYFLCNMKFIINAVGRNAWRNAVNESYANEINACVIMGNAKNTEMDGHRT